MLGNDLTVKLGLDGRPFTQGLDHAMRDAQGKVSRVNRAFTSIGSVARGFGAVILVRQLANEMEELRRIMNETPDLFTQDQIDRAEAQVIAMERMKKTVQELKLMGWNYLERFWASRAVMRLQRGGSGDASHATQEERTAKMEEKLRTAQERRRKVDADLAKIATARERAEKRIRDLYMEQLDPAEQIAFLQREHAEAAADLLRHKEGTTGFYAAQERVAERALEILRKTRPEEVKEQSFNVARGSAGRLASIGGDVGGLNDRVVTIEKEQVRILKQIASNTRARTPGSGGLEIPTS